jgi:hypothetical protein
LEAGGGGDIGGGGAAMFEDENLFYGDNNMIKLRVERDDELFSIELTGTIQLKRKLYDEISGGGAGSVEGGASIHL